MSIDPAVGALKEYLTDISTSKTYNKARNKIWKILFLVGSFILVQVEIPVLM